MKIKPKVLVAIPTTGVMRTETAIFLTKFDKTNYHVDLAFTIGGGLIHNRNLLVKKFLETNAEWFLFIDSDVAPPLNVLDMIENGKDICAGIYHQYVKAHDLVIPLMFVKKENRERFAKDDIVGDVIEVDGAATGCMLIHRRVFEKVKKPYFEIPYDKDGLSACSEDIYFCGKAQKAGFKIWIDKRMIGNHYKIMDLKSVFLKYKDHIKTK